jgi:multiple antibiotic resistance protein
MGWALLNQRDPAPPGPAQVVPVSYGAIEEKVFYPLTFPVTVDPACIVVMLTLSAHASTKTVEENILSHSAILGAVMLLSILVYFCYAYAPRITAHIPAQTAHGILRIIAFVLFCIGVQISWNGVHAMIRVVMGLKG